MELRSQGLDPIHNLNLSHRYGNPGSLTHCAGLGINPVSQCTQGAPNSIAPQQGLCVFWFYASFLWFEFDLSVKTLLTNEAVRGENVSSQTLNMVLNRHFFFSLRAARQKFRVQGLNPCQSSDNTRSLTYCTTRKLFNRHLLNNVLNVELQWVIGDCVCPQRF